MGARKIIRKLQDRAKYLEGQADWSKDKSRCGRYKRRCDIHTAKSTWSICVEILNWKTK